MWSPLLSVVFCSTLLIGKINATDTPVVGLLAQEAMLLSITEAYPEAHSFIIGSYVKLLESSGARVLPVWIGQDEDYYSRVVKYTNGILFPGGGTYYNNTGGYGEAARQLYNLAIKENDAGVHYPLFGICLGMQVLPYAAIGEVEDTIRKYCSAKNIALNLNLVIDYKESNLLAGAPAKLIEEQQANNLTFHNHGFCILEDGLRQSGLLGEWTITSINRDVNGLEFVNILENAKYPFYGTQFHPERNAFEFKKSNPIPHSPEAVKFSQYLSKFFVDDCRFNNHSFPDDGLERDSLIYNYSPVYSAAKTAYEQLYLWKEEDYEQNQLI